jgi:hypothetical protein
LFANFSKSVIISIVFNSSSAVLVLLVISLLDLFRIRPEVCQQNMPVYHSSTIFLTSLSDKLFAFMSEGSLACLRLYIIAVIAFSVLL